MMTDLAPYQQVAAVILRLSGAAKDLARTLTPNEILNGGISPTGVQLDPLSYLVVGLHARFARLGEETRLQATRDLLSFGRRSGEGINQALARYEIFVDEHAQKDSSLCQPKGVHSNCYEHAEYPQTK